jgi:hypothetical protein
MRVVKDLIGGSMPSTIELPYNGEVAADSTTLRYAGSVAKVMDFDDIDNGEFVTFGGLATIGERVIGILEEPQGTSGNYLPNDASYGLVYRKITPCFPSTVVEAEYAQKDAAGTDNLDTNFTGSAASATLTNGNALPTTADVLIGGWVYFTNGSNANYLHYITDNGAGNGAITLATALVNAVAATDDLVVVLPPMARKCLFDATYTGIKSEVDDGAHTFPIMGLSTWISAPSIPLQKLDRNKHDGLSVAGARFYHQFTFCGQIDDNAATIPNAWMGVNA